MIDVVALGELLIDFTCVSTDPAGYPTMAAHPGGAPANFLAALTKYGCKTALLGKVGNDTFGDLLLNTLQNAGIETKGMIRTDEVFTTLAFVTFDEGGDRKIAFARKPGADTQISFEELDLSLIDEASCSKASLSKFFLGCSRFGSTLLILTRTPSTTFSFFAPVSALTVSVGLLTLFGIRESIPFPKPPFLALAIIIYPIFLCHIISE